jgi:hypothetical protein
VPKLGSTKLTTYRKNRIVEVDKAIAITSALGRDPTELQEKLLAMLTSRDHDNVIVLEKLFHDEISEMDLDDKVNMKLIVRSMGCAVARTKMASVRHGVLTVLVSRSVLFLDKVTLVLASPMSWSL